MFSVLIKMALIVLCGLNGQNNEGRSLMIKGLQTEKNVGEEQMPNKRVSEQHYHLACIFFLN